MHTQLIHSFELHQRQWPDLDCDLYRSLYNVTYTKKIVLFFAGAFMFHNHVVLLKELTCTIIEA